MKYSELTRLLRNNGCFLVKHGANHDKWKSPITGLTFPVPRHGTEEVATGTAKSILKKAGVE